MAVFSHPHSKFLNLTAGCHKPAQSTPVHHWMYIQCSLGELPLCSKNSSLSLSPLMTWRKMTSVLGAICSSSWWPSPLAWLKKGHVTWFWLTRWEAKSAGGVMGEVSSFLEQRHRKRQSLFSLQWLPWLNGLRNGHSHVLPAWGGNQLIKEGRTNSITERDGAGPQHVTPGAQPIAAPRVTRDNRCPFGLSWSFQLPAAEN